ncbi:bolA-like protein DDB_G0274169 isoform X1 [Agrilus planipennis]|uniref:BolA-like protein DDB_G0274169 isoform X1 n=2 Tax=Agrilus planipennis TaxID=224129 RepID=A0A1W4WSX7_AGRPL|nr:bolA-like protein DDB_G0274169 isoform X1 [Agrilus planipennis]
MRIILHKCSVLYRSVTGIKTKMSISSGVIQSAITNKLKTNLNTTHLEVINESYMHNVPKGSETHFKVVVISEKFKDLPLIKRHRLVNNLLKDELQSGVHALSIVAKTPEQWQESDKIIESSPNCRGGFGK